MGIVSFPGNFNREIMMFCNTEIGLFLNRFLFLGMLRRPSDGRSAKRYGMPVRQEDGA